MARPPSILSRLIGMNPSGPAKVPAFQERGVSGTPIYAGYVREIDSNAKLNGSQRWRTAADLLVNVSIVAAGIRYFLNLTAKPKWSVEAADDTPAAKEMAEFAEEILHDMKTSWPRVIRRAGMFRYHGFAIHEWTAKRRADGRIGMDDIEVRPAHTIEKWGTDEKFSVTGVWQRSPQTGEFIWLPRSKIIYLVDDMMTDSPEGMGWFRALAESGDRFQNYLKFEQRAFERNLGGVPIGRAPLSEIDQRIKAGEITDEEGAAMIAGLQDLCETQQRAPNTSMILDSIPYEAPQADGFNFSTTMKWGIDLLKGDMVGIENLGNAIDRVMHEMARIIGVESMLVGDGSTGSLALSKDKSANLYLVVNSTLQDMAEAFDRDVLDPIWALNGFDEDLRPHLKTEDVAFKDIEQISAMLRDMAAAGATLSPDDPAIDDMRDLAGISRQPEQPVSMDDAGVVRPNAPQIGPDGKPIGPQGQTGAEDDAGAEDDSEQIPTEPGDDQEDDE